MSFLQIAGEAGRFASGKRYEKFAQNMRAVAGFRGEDR
jgi:hypothetical protein